MEQNTKANGFIVKHVVKASLLIQQAIHMKETGIITNRLGLGSLRI